MGHAQQLGGGVSIPVIDGLGKPVRVPGWYGVGGGPTFSGSGLIFKGANKRAKVKKSKAAKKAAKLAKSTPTYGSVMARDMEIACSAEALSRIGKVARDARLPRGERMAALVKLDASSFNCRGMGDGMETKAVVQKAAKKANRERRERYEYLAFIRARCRHKSTRAGNPLRRARLKWTSRCVTMRARP